MSLSQHCHSHSADSEVHSFLAERVAYSVLKRKHTTQAVDRPPPTCLCSGLSQVESRPPPSTARTLTYPYSWPPHLSSSAAQGFSLFSPLSEGSTGSWAAPRLFSHYRPMFTNFHLPEVTLASKQPFDPRSRRQRRPRSNFLRVRDYLSRLQF